MPTLRQTISDLLVRGPYTPRELADEVGIKVRDVLAHLEHIRRSHKHGFRIESAQCLRCDFIFRDRQRLGTPSRCPKCRNERISEPRFSINSPVGNGNTGR